MMSLVQMSLQAAAMICVIALIRALAMGRLPMWSFQALWGVALVRLLAPVRIESPLSAYGAAERLWRVMTQPGIGASPVVGAGQAYAPPVVEEIAGLAYDAPSAASAGLPWLLIWGLGAALVMTYLLAAHMRGRRAYADALPLSSARVAGRAVSIRVSDRVFAPLTYGVLRPVVVLPKRFARGGDETRYGLAHELAHIRHYDVLKKGLLAAALVLHWFNPLVWAMVVLANRDIELGCDEAVLRQSDAGAKASYATMLLDLMERRGAPAPLASHFSVNATEERIVAIMKHNHQASRIWIFIALALVLGTASALATSAPPMALPAAVEHPTLVEEVPGAVPAEAYDAGWTAEALEAWIDEQRAALTQSIGSRFWDEKEGSYTLTQEGVDETLALYESMLDDVRRGAYLSRDMTLMQDIGPVEAPPARSVDSEEYILEQADDPPAKEAAAPFGNVSIQKSASGGYSAAIRHNGDILNIGPYATRVEFDAALSDHLRAAVAQGLITEAEAAYLVEAFAAEPDAPEVVESDPPA